MFRRQTYCLLAVYTPSALLGYKLINVRRLISSGQIIPTLTLTPVCVICSLPAEQWADWWRAWRRMKTLSPTRTAASVKTSSYQRAATAYQKYLRRRHLVSARRHSLLPCLAHMREIKDTFIDLLHVLIPAPVQCVLDKDSLVDGLRVLIPMDDQLLYSGHVNTVHSPDMWVHDRRVIGRRRFTPL